MYHQTHSVKDQDNKTAFEANHRDGQSFITILQGVWGVIRKITVSVLSGFHMLVESAEPQRPSNNAYWWNSPDAVDDLMNR